MDLLDRGILSLRAKGILFFALGIMALFFGFIFSMVFLIIDHGTAAFLSMFLGYLAFASGVYYRFIGFKKRYVARYGAGSAREVPSLDRPDVIISPMFFLYGEKLIADDYGKFAAGVILVVVAVLLMLFYWGVLSLL